MLIKSKFPGIPAGKQFQCSGHKFVKINDELAHPYGCEGYRFKFDQSLDCFYVEKQTEVA